MTEPIVVGFDDTEHSHRAVDCAVREAQARGVPLRLVNAYNWIPPVTYGLPPGLAAQQAMRDASESVVNDAAAKLRAEHPDLTVEAMVSSSDAAASLAGISSRSPLLVVGGRGRGGFAGQLLGSVALSVLSLAECPVMIVRGDPDPRTGRLMVGVDLDSPHAAADLLEFAFAEAALRGADLYVMHVWDDPAYLYLASGKYAADVFTAIGANRRRALGELLEPWQRKHPEVVVSSQVFPGSPAGRLVDSTRLADALLIGGRIRTHGHAGMRIGALAHTVLHHAHCPVIVVPEH